MHNKIHRQCGIYVSISDTMLYLTKREEFRFFFFRKHIVVDHIINIKINFMFSKRQTLASNIRIKNSNILRYAFVCLFVLFCIGLNHFIYFFKHTYKYSTHTQSYSISVSFR